MFLIVIYFRSYKMVLYTTKCKNLYPVAKKLNKND